MAKPPITQARDVDAELVLQLNKFGSAADLLAGFLAVDQGQTALAAEEVTSRRRGSAGGRACSRVALCAGMRAQRLQL